MVYAGKQRDSTLTSPAFTGILLYARVPFLFLILVISWAIGGAQCAPPREFSARITKLVNDTTRPKTRVLDELLAIRSRMVSCRQENDSAFMYLLQRIGLLYFNLQQYQPAIDNTLQAINVSMQMRGDGKLHASELVHNYSNLYYYFEQAGMPDKKYGAIDSCVQYFLQANGAPAMAETVAYALLDKSDYLFNKGEYSLCDKDAKLGEYITRRFLHGKDSILYIVSFLNKQAHFLYFSRRYEPAVQMLTEKVREFENAGHSDQLYAFYELLGLISTARNNANQALVYFTKAFRASARLGYRNGCAQSLVRTGMLYAKSLSRPDSGLYYCKQALRYADRADSLFILKAISNIYVQKGMYSRAQGYFQQAFNTVMPGLDENSMLSKEFDSPGFNQLQDLLDLTTDKGDAFYQQYLHTGERSLLYKGLEVYRKADLFLEKVKTEQQLQLGSNLVWRSTARNLYEHAIRACNEVNATADAFYFFEKSRAILLNDQVNEQRWLADQDIAEQATLKKKAVALERQLASLPPGSGKFLALQEKLNIALQQLEKLVRQIRSKNPAFFRDHLDTNVTTIAELRKSNLEGKKTLVEIFAGDHSVYVLLISPASAWLHAIDKNRYDSLVAAFNRLITDAGKLNSHFADFFGASAALFQLIFDQGLRDSAPLVISPDGMPFPFEALVTGGTTRLPVYLLRDHPTSYTYSAKYLANQFAPVAKDRIGLLGVAPVDYQAQPALTSLKGSDRSLQTIAGYFPGASLNIFQKANRDAFLRAFSRYELVQLYTHAADTSDNNDPVIYFSDSALYLSDLLPDQKPVTQLVVLSACETATGRWYEGEGMFSFNRGFAALGIPAAVSNLWSVDNLSTYRLTELFYKHLAQGIAADDALQQAKLEFIESNTAGETRLPYYWAGPILTGKVVRFEKQPRSGWKYVVGIAAVLLVGLYAGRRLRASRAGNRR